MKLKNPVTLKDALYNVHEDSGASAAYAKGLVVGAVAALMAATGKSYNEVLPLVVANLPEGILQHRLPDALRGDIVAHPDYSLRG
jgi:hypothetical protein